MEPTKEQLANREKAVASATPSTITSTNLAPQEKLVTSPAPVVQPVDVNFTPLIESVAKQEAAASSGLNDATMRSNTLADQQNTLIERLGLRGQTQIANEAKAGVPELSQKVRDYRDKLAGLEAQASTMRERVTESQRGTGRGGYDISLIESGAQRANAIDRVSASALLQAAQGNLTEAISAAERATNIEFEPIEAELKLRQAQYEQNKDVLDRFDKRASTARAQMLALEEKNIELAKAEKAEIQKLTLEAVQNGASPDVASKMMKAKTYGEAIELSGGNLFDKTKALNNQLLQERIWSEQNSRLIERAKAGSPKAMKALGIDPTSNDGYIDPNTIAYAQLYASTGTVPPGIPKGTFGEIARVAKLLPKQEGTIVDINTNTKPQLSDAKVDGLAALHDIVKKSEELRILDEKRLKGVTAGSIGYVFGSRDQAKYMNLRSEIVDLLARARSGAALTANEEEFYLGKLPGRHAEPFFLGQSSQGKITDFTTQIAGTLNTKAKAQGVAITGYSKVRVGDRDVVVGDIIQNADGKKGRVLPDGSIIDLDQ